MAAIPLVVGLLALVGLALTVRIGQAPPAPKQQAALRWRRLVLGGVALVGIVGFVVLVATGGGSGDAPDCVGTAIKSASCAR